MEHYKPKSPGAVLYTLLLCKIGLKYFTEGEHLRSSLSLPLYSVHIKIITLCII